MSVIIRLQNLPWSANALDVRTFFKGLSIPDGGVHIVGGEMGDAFIAFSTDEDARQAMMMTGGRIKEVQITLLLSSRAEMQKVIEEARRTTLSFMQLSAQSAPPVVQPASIVPKVTVPATVAQQPQPPVISLSGFLAQNLNQNQKAMQSQSIYSEIPGLGFLTTSGGVFQPNAPAAGLFSALNAQSYGPGVANSAFTQLSEQLKKATEAEKLASSKNPVVSSGATGSVSSKKESGEKSSRWSRSSSRDRDRRRSRSKSRERGRRRSGRDRSRSRSRDRRSRSRSRDRRDRRRRSRSRDRRDSRSRDHSRDRTSRDSKVEKSMKQRVSRFSDRNEEKSVSVEKVVAPIVSPWDTPIQQSLLKMASGYSSKSVPPGVTAVGAPSVNTNAFDGRNELGASNVNNPMANYKANLQPQVNYGSFQASKPISNEHLSKLQELHTRRDPRVFQGNSGGRQTIGDKDRYGRRNESGYGYPSTRSDNIAKDISSRQLPANNYSSSDSGFGDRKQVSEDMEDDSGSDDLGGQSVKVSNLENITGYGELRRFFLGQSISSNGIKMINDRDGRRTGVAYVRFLRKDGKRYALSRNGMALRKTIVKVESITDKEFEDAIDSYRPGYEDAKSSWNEDGVDKKRRATGDDVRDDANDHASKSGSLVVWNLPSMTTELDLMRIFSDFTVMEVLIIKNYKNPKQSDGYVKFHRLEDARRAAESTHKHYIRNKRMFVKQCTDIEYDAAKNEYDAPEDVEVVTQQLSEDVDDSVQEILEDSKESKKDDDDDKMDLAEDDEDGEDNEQEIQQNVIPQGQMSDDPPLHNQDKGEYEEESWEQEESENPVQTIRDPRNAFSQNFFQAQLLPSQPQRAGSVQDNAGCRSDGEGQINRDPRNAFGQSRFQQQQPPQQRNAINASAQGFASEGEEKTIRDPRNAFGLGRFQSQQPPGLQQQNAANAVAKGFASEGEDQTSRDPRNAFGHGRFQTQQPPPQLPRNLVNSAAEGFVSEGEDQINRNPKNALGQGRFQPHQPPPQLPRNTVNAAAKGFASEGEDQTNRDPRNTFGQGRFQPQQPPPQLPQNLTQGFASEGEDQTNRNPRNAFGHSRFQPHQVSSLQQWSGPKQDNFGFARSDCEDQTSRSSRNCFQPQKPSSQLLQRTGQTQDNVGFGSDVNRDPRRRHEIAANKRSDGSQSGFQSDNSRDSFENSRNSFASSQSQSRFNPQAPPPHGPMGGNNSRFDQSMNRSKDSHDDGADKTTFILIHNLEFGLTEMNVREFFDQEGFNPKTVHIIRNQYGRSTGECLVGFETPQEAGETLVKNSAIIGKRKAFIKQLTRNQILEVMERVNPNQGGSAQSYGRGGNMGNNNFVRNNNYNDRPNFGRGNYGGNSYGDNNGDYDNFGNNNSGNNNFGNSNFGSHNSGNNNSGDLRGNDNWSGDNNNGFGGSSSQSNAYQNNASKSNFDNEGFSKNDPDNQYQDEYDDQEDYDNQDQESVDESQTRAEETSQNVENEESETEKQHSEEPDYSRDVGAEDLPSVAPAIASQSKESADEPQQTKASEDIKEEQKQNVQQDQQEAQQPHQQNHDQEEHQSNQQTKEQEIQQSEQQTNQPANTQENQQLQQENQRQQQEIQQVNQQASEHENQQIYQQGNQQRYQLGNGQNYQQDDDMCDDQQGPPAMCGNIITLANLPFRARSEELVAFFGDYNITMDDVKRRYLPDGRATGDAMIRFQSASDAQRALASHKQRRLGGRPIRMMLANF